MTGYDPEQQNQLKLPNDEATVYGTFDLLSGNPDFGDALNDEALTSVLESLKSFLDDPNPHQKEAFIVQIIARGEKGSADFMWISFHWHRVYGEGDADWGIAMPRTQIGEPVNGMTGLGLDLEDTFGYEYPANVVLGWESLKPEYVLERLPSNDQPSSES